MVAYSLSMFALGSFANREYSKNLRVLKKQVKHFYEIPFNYARGQFTDPKTLIIDIKHKHYQKLAFIRQKALERGLLRSEDNEFVPARVSYNGESAKARIRLKGDWTDHLEGEKWSFRIKLKGKNTFEGMKVFSVQHPDTRNFIGEWIYHKGLEYENLLALKYDFIKVIVNGKDLGIFALEEHFDKRLIERAERKEAPILKFTENAYFSKAKKDSYHIDQVDSFQTSKVLESKVLSEQYRVGRMLLEKFKNRELTTSEVFDIDTTARYYAITDLLGGQHGNKWHNERYYYNPITSRLESVGYDAYAGRDIIAPRLFLNVTEPINSGYYEWLFSDQKFTDRYLEELFRMTSNNYLGNFLNSIKEEYREKMNILHSEFPTFIHDFDTFYGNASNIAMHIDPKYILRTRLVSEDKDSIVLAISNISRLPVYIKGLSHKKALLKEKEGSTRLAGRVPTTPIKETYVTFSRGNSEEEVKAKKLKVHYSFFPNEQRLRTADVMEKEVLPPPLKETEAIRLASTISKFNFVSVKGKEIHLKPGKHVIETDLIIPSGYTFVARKGTHIILKNKASIISYSAADFVGSADSPIIIEGNGGQGFAVLNVKKTRSKLRHVNFRNLSNLRKGNWAITGAVVFYYNPVDIFDTHFYNNDSEDALNIIHANFRIHKSIFEKTFADAFDCDFCDGEITDSVFLNVGNDGIDVSGSQVKVSNVRMRGLGDKGVSSGEASQVEVVGTVVEKSAIAYASKDNSSLSISYSEAKDSDYAYAVYVKKPEYGPGSISVKKSKIEAVKSKYAVEEGSVLKIDAIAIKPTHKDLKEIFYADAPAKKL